MFGTGQTDAKFCLRCGVYMYLVLGTSRRLLSRHEIHAAYRTNIGMALGDMGVHGAHVHLLVRREGSRRNTHKYHQKIRCIKRFSEGTRFD